MKVRIQQCLSGPEGTWQEGTVHEVDWAEGMRLIDKHVAVLHSLNADEKTWHYMYTTYGEPEGVPVIILQCLSGPDYTWREGSVHYVAPGFAQRLVDARIAEVVEVADDEPSEPVSDGYDYPQDAYAYEVAAVEPVLEVATVKPKRQRKSRAKKQQGEG